RVSLLDHGSCARSGDPREWLFPPGLCVLTFLGLARLPGGRTGLGQARTLVRRSGRSLVRPAPSCTCGALLPSVRSSSSAARPGGRERARASSQGGGAPRRPSAPSEQPSASSEGGAGASSASSRRREACGEPPEEWLWHVAGCIAADWLAGGPHVSPGASLAALALGMADYPEFLCRFGGQVAGALLAWPFCGIIGAPLGLKPLGGPSFDPALLPLEQAALYEASAAFLLNLAVLSLNHAERLVPLRRFYLLKAGLTAAVIRVMLQGRGDRGRRPTLWSTTPATGAPPSAAPSQRPACSRTAPGAPSSGPRLGPRALPARSGSPSSSDPRGGAAAVARRVGAAATPARPLSDIRSVGSLVLRFPPGQRLGRIRCGVAAQAALPRRTPQTLRS
ncbi:unnamed protein product, partial [Prorocentrum cordatum]